MSLAGVMTALVEYVGQVLVDDCGRPAPSRVLRYFGSNGLPQDCCTEDGVLSISVDRGFPSDTFPSDASGKSDPCAVYPAYTLAIRYDVCWSAPPMDATGIELLDDTWDADAAMLTDVADCVARALIRLGCADKVNDSPEAQAVLELLRRTNSHAIRYREYVPSPSPGSCARLTWRVYAGPRSSAPPS